MADATRYWDCAVVNEVHLLRDPSCGWNFTRAVLGLYTKELHICGSPAAVDIVTALVNDCGDDLEVREYERLSPLKITKRPLKSLASVKQGDCLVTFSRSEIFQLKRKVEKETGLRCCVLYGSLPLEARSLQATLFTTANSGYDILVASDAIGMGLNLNIGRIVFTRTAKYDGIETRINVAWPRRWRCRRWRRCCSPWTSLPRTASPSAPPLCPRQTRPRQRHFMLLLDLSDRVKPLSRRLGSSVDCFRGGFSEVDKMVTNKGAHPLQSMFNSVCVTVFLRFFIHLPMAQPLARHQCIISCVVY
jgi:hypothetical protein